MNTGRRLHSGHFVIVCILAWSIVAISRIWIHPVRASCPLVPGCQPTGPPSMWRQQSEGARQAQSEGQILRALLTPTEHMEFRRQSNIAKRMKLLLKFAAKRLERIHHLALREEYDEVAQLSNEYKALITSAYSLIETISPNPSRRKSAYRDFDLELRKQIRALEQIERLIPLSQSGDITDAMRTATRLRHNALNAFAGDRIFKSPTSKQH